MRYSIVILGCLIVTVIFAFASFSADSVTFLDVGQGDAILIQTGTQQVLIDGGQGVAVLSRLAEEMPWFDQHIDVIISTHPDRDHVEGLLHVLSRYDVGLVLLPEVAQASQLQEEWMKLLRQKIHDQSLAYRFAVTGQEIKLNNDIRISVLGPSVEILNIVQQNAKTNNASVTTRVDIHGTSFLLSGDAEQQTERALVASVGKGVLDVDILKAGHHGSKTSTTTEFLEAASPRAVVISVGSENRYGHPHPTVLQRLAGVQVLRTDEIGSVRFKFLKDSWHLSCSRKPCIKT